MWLLVVKEFRDYLPAALSGPFGFRFFVQPLIAVSLGIFYLTGSIRILTSLVVGTLLVAVPYMVARTLSNRMTVRRLYKKRR